MMATQIDGLILPRAHYESSDADPKTHPARASSNANAVLSVRKHISCSRGLLKSAREALEVLCERAVIAQELDVGAVDLDAALLAQLDVLLAA